MLFNTIIYKENLSKQRSKSKLCLIDSQKYTTFIFSSAKV